MDPVVKITITLCLSVLFASAATHKILNRSVFYNQLSAYRLLPPVLLGFGVLFLPLIEMSLATALLIPFMSKLALGASSFLLLFYGMIMLSAIMRGHRSIDCGCSGAEGATSISYAHIVRNLLLALAAVAGSLPSTGRALNGYDWVFVILMTMTVIAFYQTSNQLMANAPNLKSEGHGT